MSSIWKQLNMWSFLPVRSDVTASLKHTFTVKVYARKLCLVSTLFFLCHSNKICFIQMDNYISILLAVCTTADGALLPPPPGITV